MNPITTFILCCLACWRICHFVAKEDGPFYFMWDIRYFLQDNVVGELVSCVNCLSIWLSAMFCLAMFWHSWFLYWLAMSAVVMILEAIYAMLRWKSIN